MKSLLLVMLLVLSLASGEAHAASPAPPASPAAFAARFYRTYLKLKISGLPDERQYRALAPLLSSELRQLLAAARLEQATAAKERPDEKPPWADGDLFTSLQEGAQSFRVGRPEMRGAYADVPVSLEYRGGGSVTRWKDTLVLVRTARGWRVWDILFKGEWEFKNGGSLRGVLAAK